MNLGHVTKNSLIALMIVVIAGQIGVRPVGASPNRTSCNEGGPTNGNVNYGDYETSRGISITVDEIKPEGIVIVGQDEDRIGVSFQITVTSHPGTITYEKPVKTCGGPGSESIYTTLEGRGDPCEPPTIFGYDGGGHPYYRYKYWGNICVPKTETVYRGINNVIVWLEPTPETVDLIEGGRNKSVPRIYPQDWYEFKLDIHFNFPDINISIDELPFLEASGYMDKKKVEGMFIDETNPRNPENFILFVYTHIPTFCGSPKDYDCGIHETNGPGSLSDTTINFDISPFQLPIQFPGKWNIVVWVILEPAQYGDPKRDEALEPGNPNDDLGRFPTDDEAKQYSFESHAIISSPCNPAEQYGCTDHP